ncbi:hypothetical protein JAAARDRAFT_40448 [Jaapia argillacea MUCL 33604]|uniref:PH domain-containing protein n=1 Tax=Jaapia argillacea MUCL 33604 TaxID=933084 RepID=A0A067PP03_9AGAM|nr:hypothetical protein JAAARDRAFT_40448 [Jaapia argillacea MUCL 33604]
MDPDTPPHQIIPLSFRYIPYDLYLTTHVDSSWKVKQLKQYILSKCIDPGVYKRSKAPDPPSHRPLSPITFAGLLAGGNGKGVEGDEGEEREGEEADTEKRGKRSEDGLLGGLDDEDDEDERGYCFANGSTYARTSIPSSLPSSYPSSSSPPPTPAATNTPLSPFHYSLFTLLSFSTTRILQDEYTLAWYGLQPYELVEMHPVGGIVKVDRGIVAKYVEPYFEGRVRTLRVVWKEVKDPADQRKDASSIASSSNRLTKSKPDSLPFSDPSPIIPVRSSPSLPIKKSSKIEWRERWVVISGGVLRLCKDRKDPSSGQSWPLSTLHALRGSEHLSKAVVSSSSSSSTTLPSTPDDQTKSKHSIICAKFTQGHPVGRNVHFSLGHGAGGGGNHTSSNGGRVGTGGGGVMSAPTSPLSPPPNLFTSGFVSSPQAYSFGSAGGGGGEGYLQAGGDLWARRGSLPSLFEGSGLGGPGGEKEKGKDVDGRKDKDGEGKKDSGKKEKEKEEDAIWIVLDLLDECAYTSLLRILHLHSGPHLSSSFLPRPASTSSNPSTHTSNSSTSYSGLISKPSSTTSSVSTGTSSSFSTISSLSTATATSKLSTPTTNSNRPAPSKSNSNPNLNRPATASNPGLSVHMRATSVSPLVRPATSVGVPSASVGVRPSIITGSSLNHVAANGRERLGREPYPAWRVGMVRKARQVGMGGLGGLSGAWCWVLFGNEGIGKRREEGVGVGLEVGSGVGRGKMEGGDIEESVLGDLDRDEIECGEDEVGLSEDREGREGRDEEDVYDDPTPGYKEESLRREAMSLSLTLSHHDEEGEGEEDSEMEWEGWVEDVVLRLEREKEGVGVGVGVGGHGYGEREGWGLGVGAGETDLDPVSVAFTMPWHPSATTTTTTITSAVSVGRAGGTNANSTNSSSNSKSKSKVRSRMRSSSVCVGGSPPVPSSSSNPFVSQFGDVDGVGGVKKKRGLKLTLPSFSNPFSSKDGDDVRENAVGVRSQPESAITPLAPTSNFIDMKGKSRRGNAGGSVRDKSFSHSGHLKGGGGVGHLRHASSVGSLQGSSIASRSLIEDWDGFDTSVGEDGLLPLPLPSTHVVYGGGVGKHHGNGNGNGNAGGGVGGGEGGKKKGKGGLMRAVSVRTGGVGGAANGAAKLVRRFDGSGDLPDGR